MSDIKGVVLKENDFTSNLNGVYVNQNKINKVKKKNKSY